MKKQKKTPTTKTKTTTFKLNEIDLEMPSSVYHSVEGTSSSQLKVIREDEELFFKKYIEKSIEREEHDAFDVGNYFHVGVLEPHKIEQECCVFPGKIRSGAAWEEFKKQNAHRTIVTQKQIDVAQGLIKAVQDSPVAMGYLDQAIAAEASLFVEMFVYKGEIFCNEQVLEKWTGWEAAVPQQFKAAQEKGTRLIIKVRADSLGENHILDLKSTTGNAKNQKAMEAKIKLYDYDLSAALYCDVFSVGTGKTYSDFLWTFASKDYYNSRTYKASKESLIVGRGKYMEAIFKLAEGIRHNWTLPDSLGEIMPCYEDKQYLNRSDTDLV